MKCIICEIPIQKQKQSTNIEDTCSNCKKHIMSFIRKSESDLIDKVNALH